MTQTGRRAGRHSSLSSTIYVVVWLWAACHELIRLRVLWMDTPLDVTLPIAGWFSLQLTSPKASAVMMLLCLRSLLRVKLLLNNHVFCYPEAPRVMMVEGIGSLAEV